ncbi:peptidase M50-like protein [Algoriphagus ratkowskyi]|uniref:Peptidase M50-like protein n=1 Tax=Algoriphagus ratkowskyi TaxID=57028 RepID=A0A2W7QV64_9BACT|nr:site-2 protease family protein [Algoriphagus ratkowskyi]PZX52468.1 peptidase M50-like protein [Algoriphagus ratkowskyi]TXD76188.1 site-2 protease family protein [Algoriphagus ratkowskyi]
MYSNKDYLRHGILFITTLIATTLAGGEWVYGKSVLGNGESLLTWEYFWMSMAFSIPFIGILLIHELGHFFTAIYHKVKCTLPYFIPGWLGFIGIPTIGTFGAVIQMKGFINSRKKFFDIGVAGPLAGFVIALGVLIYGFSTLPDLGYINTIHPEYADPDFQGFEEGSLDFELGNNLLFWSLTEIFADPERMPAMSEVIHYPYLFAGFLALFFTALNLLPIGQLDGGHVVFGLFPKRHKEISLTAYILFIAYAGMGIISPYSPLEDLALWIPLYIGFLFICFSKSGMSLQNRITLVLSVAAIQYGIAFFIPDLQGYQGWLFYGFLLGRVMGIQHPEVSGFKELDRNRKLLGWLAIVIFILCFSPQPFIFSE